MQFIKFGLRSIGRSEREPDVNELLHIQIAMPVLCSAPRRGKRGARRIDSLPLVAQIDATGNLADELRCQPQAA